MRRADSTACAGAETGRYRGVGMDEDVDESVASELVEAMVSRVGPRNRRLAHVGAFPERNSEEEEEEEENCSPPPRQLLRYGV